MTESGNPMLESEASNKVGTILYGMLFSTDERITLRVSATSSVRIVGILAYNPEGKHALSDGHANSVSATPELRDALTLLRAAYYHEDKGTWFSVEFEVSAEGAMTARFNYDNEPDWGDEGIDPAAYVEDLRAFPRSEDNQPAWLKLKLAADARG
jgi:hypothetical protein